MSYLTSGTFWSAAGERAVKTAAQSLVAVGLAGATGLFDADWSNALSVAGLAAVLSALTSVGSGAVGDATPSLVGEAPAESTADPLDDIAEH